MPIKIPAELTKLILHVRKKEGLFVNGRIASPAAMFENLFHRNAYYALKVAKHFSFYWKMHASLPSTLFLPKSERSLAFR